MNFITWSRVVNNELRTSILDHINTKDPTLLERLFNCIISIRKHRMCQINIQKWWNYCKDTEAFISYFHVLTSNTSFQYLHQLLTIYQGVHITYFKINCYFNEWMKWSKIWTNIWTIIEDRCKNNVICKSNVSWWLKYIYGSRAVVLCKLLPCSGEL